MPSQQPYMRWQHNKRAASGTPSMANMNNDAMMKILACRQDILSDLKRAYREEMQNHVVNGKPFLGQLPSEVDASGEIRNLLWRNVAKSDKKLRDTLKGKRHGSEKPINFDANVAAVKNKICSDHTNERRKRRGGVAYAPEKEVAPGSTNESVDDGGNAGATSPSLMSTSAPSADHDEQMVGAPGGEILPTSKEEVSRDQTQQGTAIKRQAPSSWRSYPTKRLRPAQTAALAPSPLRTMVTEGVSEEQVSAPFAAAAGGFKAPVAPMQFSNRNASEDNAVPTIERASRDPPPFRMTTDVGRQISDADIASPSPPAGTKVLSANPIVRSPAHHGDDADTEIKVEERMTMERSSARVSAEYGDEMRAQMMQQGDRTASISSEGGVGQYRPTKVSFFGKRLAMNRSGAMPSARDNDITRQEMPPPRITNRKQVIVADDDDTEGDDDDEDERFGFRERSTRSSTGLFVSEVDHSNDATVATKKKTLPPVRNFALARPAGLGLRPLIQVEGVQTAVSGVGLPPSETRSVHDDGPSMRAVSTRDESGAPSVKTPPPPREISESVGSTIEVAAAPTKVASTAAHVNASEAGSRSPDSSPEPDAETAQREDGAAAAKAHSYPTRSRLTTSIKTKPSAGGLFSPTPTASDTTISPMRTIAAKADQRAKSNKKDDKQLGDAMKTMIAYQVSNMAQKLSKDFDKRSKELEARLVDYVDQRLEEMANDMGKGGDEELKERIRAEILRELREGLVGE